MKPLARYASLYGYADLTRSLGVDPIPLLRERGLDPASLNQQDRWLPAVTVAELLETTAAVAGCDDFGLRLAERRRFANLGPLSLAVREEPDVRSALHMLARYQHAYNEAVWTRLYESDELATLRVELDCGEPVEERQSSELAVAALHRLLRGFLGPQWKPVAVYFHHRPPKSTAPHRKFFGPTVRFDQEFAGIEFAASELDLANKMSDPLLRPYAQRVLQSLEPPKDAVVVDRVRSLIELLLPIGRCSVEQVARSLGVDRRTVHRRLAESGETYSSVLNAARVDLAKRMVGSSRYSLTEIAQLLSFSAPSNFSRWFRTQFGCSPRQWQDEKRRAGGA
ncbi:AraC family transcriptional regulator [Mycolicibacter heraklionensis]|uniref:AraC family transcriptional regulator n=1 Tax=Mycolicibacter heraklionensis TaxID=512402 RepID=UPI0007EC1710|nr:AraC family transcriptional regulator [Mycolicibacter heraklionensis]OBG32362.1 AraC family transcriptional regulator [Mycolicibacter heraklionensis]